VKNERRKQWQESKQLLKNQNLKAQNELFDKEKIEKITEDSVAALKKGKKITLTK